MAQAPSEDGQLSKYRKGSHKHRSFTHHFFIYARYLKMRQEDFLKHFVDP